MTDSRTIYQGQNDLRSRQFLQRDGDLFDFANVNALTATLEYADGTNITTYSYTTGGGFTEGLSHLGSCEFQLDIKEDVTAAFNLGEIFCRWDLKVANPSRLDLEERFIYVEHILTVI